MIAFEISRNGQVLSVVGTRDLIGLHAMLMVCGDLNSPSGAANIFYMTANGFGKRPGENTAMRHTWSIAPTEGDFELGDTLSIRIIQTASPTPPTTSEQLEDSDTEDEDQDGRGDGEEPSI